MTRPTLTEWTEPSAADMGREDVQGAIDLMDKIFAYVRSTGSAVFMRGNLLLSDVTAEEAMSLVVALNEIRSPRLKRAVLARDEMADALARGDTRRAEEIDKELWALLSEEPAI